MISAQVSRDGISMMRKPSWDMKEERADEADNPGPTENQPPDPDGRGRHNKRNQHIEDSEGDRKTDKHKLRKIIVDEVHGKAR